MQFRFFVLFFSFLMCIGLQAQQSTYSQNYFRNPLGIPIQLSANFGELRSGHWHMGLDIRTNQRENQPVYAAADGYISHIGIRSNSFGRFIVINHPNGLSTLYAHLNDFFPELENYVVEQQYKQESWAVELDFNKDQFPVKKGKFIAYSGNTGGSLGPHLHFEIFDTKTTKRLNPLLFGMPVTDNMAPTVVRLALYDRTKSLYEQSPQLFLLTKSGGDYVIKGNSLIKTDLNKLSFAIQTYDKSSSGSSPNGIFSAQLDVDDVPQIMFLLDSIDYDETAYINAQIDYKHDYNGGVYLQHLSCMPGDKGPVYKKIKSDGVIELNDTDVHEVQIEVKDANGNSSLVKFEIQKNESSSPVEEERSGASKVIPNTALIIGKPGFEVFIPKSGVYDTVNQTYIRNEKIPVHAVSVEHKIMDEFVPLHSNITVRIKADKKIPDDWRSKIIIQRSGKGNSVRKATWEGEWMVASFGDFGTFQAFADIIPPSVNELGKGDTINLSSSSRILFTPRDNFEVIRNFRAELDGKWLCFTNDKGKNWIYKFDDRCPYGVHHLKIYFEDIVGNSLEKEWWFRREPYTPPKKKTSKKK
ncbi:MAG TPA: M23 family metallopeptidase [Chitinophagaceae bacterium]|nr:M23 family metallopeptidase [Chitinophagaceae bacterium]